MSLTAAHLVDLWDRCAARGPAGRALTLLDAAGSLAPTESSSDGLAIGTANAHLMALRERLFGADVASLASCPACGSSVAVDFSLAGLRAMAAAAAPVPPDGVRIATETDTLSVRLPTYEDLGALEADPEGGVRALLQRCVLSQPHGALTDDVIEAVGAQLEAADPLADPRANVVCPDCGAAFAARFDIVDFLWAELDWWARRLLGDVHVLASAYGWGEADILALSPARRQAYRDMADGR